MAGKPTDTPTKTDKRNTIKRKTSIAIVGAGRMGTALGLALSSRGYLIEAIVARRKATARRAAKFIGTRPLVLTSAQIEDLPSTDILLITTPDDAIASTASQLAGIFKSRGAGAKRPRAKGEPMRTALHASGAHSSDALRSLRDAGYAIGSLHPLVSVSDSTLGAASLRSAYFCIEGDGTARRVARSMVRALGAESFSVNSRDKALYHAAAVMASGHVTALFDIAIEMLTQCGLTRNRAREVLLPLLRSTFENLGEFDPAKALTGTFARADSATVRQHLQALRTPAMREARAAYTLLGLRSLKLAKAAGANADALSEIASVIAGAAEGQRE